MRRPISATGSLGREAVQEEFERVRQTLKAMGLTSPPDRMCASVRRYGRGWAVFVGFQDSDD